MRPSLSAAVSGASSSAAKLECREEDSSSPTDLRGENNKQYENLCSVLHNDYIFLYSYINYATIEGFLRNKKIKGNELEWMEEDSSSPTDLRGRKQYNFFPGFLAIFILLSTCHRTTTTTTTIYFKTTPIIIKFLKQCILPRIMPVSNCLFVVIINLVRHHTKR